MIRYRRKAGEKSEYVDRLFIRNSYRPAEFTSPKQKQAKNPNGSMSQPVVCLYFSYPAVK